MSGDDDESPSGKTDPKAAREARLADALRANLRRRKARARAARRDAREEDGEGPERAGD